ncbi:hypothetical protein TPAR_04479 [Tolypocladium paradoxum]|uniref:Uncharacterized protein n=1 Tax=Tolypocladium paradoxum TaxID=94208 RepID=A0A2S4KYR0_9HYPO|nr:hypothetical protein TPAR_04479 [Tolypocladium paradoxum]
MGGRRSNGSRGRIETFMAWPELQALRRTERDNSIRQADQADWKAYFQRVEKAKGEDLVPRRVDILEGRVEQDGRPFHPIRNFAGHAGQAYVEAADGNLRPLPCCFMCKLTMRFSEVCRGTRGSDGRMDMFDRNK